MSEIINDIPTILPELPNNPFESNEFKAKWYLRYKNGGCTKGHIQRLYNLGKITEEDFKLITDELPNEKVIPPKSKVNELQDKISILTDENEQLKQGLKAVLSGDVQTLAYILYPEDFGSEVELSE